ncbi:hypothetical protein BU26DRAFT_76753 [Trematosphaeria pertusa]|uniref:Uncharacterized protein n=1 Tax=Trematosphaeria pertusa TaxID=390896 RepID=A0A6A6I558_9PLEO|nr:uncharacterized protein BU26DRAFT_76753 [Trematosphaeria pertusa]KAF2245092.1 hypothetical protein BU26DRAFT_76753 [Trematosphaeria pertusa]
MVSRGSGKQAPTYCGPSATRRAFSAASCPVYCSLLTASPLSTAASKRTRAVRRGKDGERSFGASKDRNVVAPDPSRARAAHPADTVSEHTAGLQPYLRGGTFPDMFLCQLKLTIWLGFCISARQFSRAHFVGQGCAIPN